MVRRKHKRTIQSEKKSGKQFQKGEDYQGKVTEIENNMDGKGSKIRIKGSEVQ